MTSLAGLETYHTNKIILILDGIVTGANTLMLGSSDPSFDTLGMFTDDVTLAKGDHVQTLKVTGLAGLEPELELNQEAPPETEAQREPILTENPSLNQRTRMNPMPKSTKRTAASRSY